MPFACFPTYGNSAFVNVVRRLIRATLAQTRSMFDRAVIDPGDCKHPKEQI